MAEPQPAAAADSAGKHDDPCDALSRRNAIRDASLGGNFVYWISDCSAQFTAHLRAAKDDRRSNNVDL